MTYPSRSTNEIGERKNGTQAKTKEVYEEKWITLLCY